MSGRIFRVAFFWVSAVALAAAAPPLLGSSPLVGECRGDEVRQARSVHLWYAPCAKDADAAEATVTVTECQTNSYFMAIGWECGYCGLQDFFGEKVFIFSVWEPGDPSDSKAREESVAEQERAKVVYAAKNVDIGRFSGEGTGVRTLSNICWKIGEPVTIRIEAEPDGDERMVFTAFVRFQGYDWLKIASLSTICRDEKSRRLDNLSSFVEDFWRNGVSAKLSRRAEFRDLRSRSRATKEWVAVEAAYFTADNTKTDNIDAGPTGDGGFFLQTGGRTVNSHVKLWDKFRP